jgi:hypothetical protein
LGLPFPFGTSHITVRADGEITGLRHDEHLQFDECTFAITVEDPQIPEVDGRLYHCKDDVDKTSPSFVKPYRVCGGTDLTWTPHATYIHTHGYDVAGVHDASKECCTDQFDVEHECVPVETDVVSVKPLASYCKPKAPAPEEEAVEEKTEEAAVPTVVAEDETLATTPEPEAAPLSLAAAACPAACSACSAGPNIDTGGVALVNSVCTAWCSSSNYCGTSKQHKIGGTDCTDCE